MTASEIELPDSPLVQEITALAKKELTPLLFNHSARVYEYGALAGIKRGLKFEKELLYAGAMFHDFGLMPKYISADERFEVDGANAAKKFLSEQKISEAEIYEVWTSIALHATPGIPRHLAPTVALVSAGVEMDVVGLGYRGYSAEEIETVEAKFARSPEYKEEIIQALYDGVRSKPQTSFGNIQSDIISDKKPGLPMINFCQLIRSSPWG